MKIASRGVVRPTAHMASRERESHSSGALRTSLPPQPVSREMRFEEISAPAGPTR